MSAIKLSCDAFRGAFFDLMMQQQHGFHINGSHDGSQGSPYFFARDNVHPWARSYQFMAELCINFLQQVRGTKGHLIWLGVLSWFGLLRCTFGSVPTMLCCKLCEACPVHCQGHRSKLVLLLGTS
jgi:hypothetical protein